MASRASNRVEERPSVPDDRALVTRCQSGDRSAFDELVLRYQDRIFRLAMHMLHDREDAYDVAQECFVKAYRGLATFRGEAAFSTWLYRIAIHASTCHLRRTANRMRRRHVSLGGPDSDAPNAGAMQPAVNTPGPEEMADRVEQRSLVRQAIRTLESEHRVVVLLRDIEGMTYDEIGGLLQCPVGTVKSRLHRAREQLRQTLAPLLAPEHYSHT